MSSKWHGGKGSSPRKVDKSKFDSNWDNIFGKKKTMEIVTIYSGPNCAYCTQAKELAEQRGYEVNYLDITEVSPKEWIDKIGSVPRSVPQIFLGDEYIGGFNAFNDRTKPE